MGAAGPIAAGSYHAHDSDRLDHQEHLSTLAAHLEQENEVTASAWQGVGGRHRGVRRAGARVEGATYVIVVNDQSAFSSVLWAANLGLSPDQITLRAFHD
jgi:hypothetical protein